MPGIKPQTGQQTPREKQTRKPRPHGFARQRMTPTQRVAHAVESCPDCGTRLSGGWTHRTREVIDLPVVPVQVTGHVFIARTCPVCEKRRVPKVDLGGVALGKQRLGVNLLSLMATLRPDGGPAGGGEAALPHHPVVSADRPPVAPLRRRHRPGHPPSGPAGPTGGGPDSGAHPGQPGGPRRRDRLAGGRRQRLRLDFQHSHRAVLPAPGPPQGGGGRGAG